MAITHFQRTIWSAKIQRALETITGLKNHSDYQYQGEIKMAKEVKILGIVAPTIRTYVPGTPITRETPTDSSQLLKIDQFRYFDIAVEDIDIAQSQKGLMDALSDEAGKGLAMEADKYIASIVATGVGDGTIDSKAVTITKTNAVDTIETALASLYEKNVPTTEELYFEVSPAVFSKIRQAITELATSNVDLIKKGAVGKYGNALVCIDNNLPVIGSATGCIMRTKKAVAYVGQIDKVEAYRPHDSFQDAIKGLFVFGAKVVRPEQIYVIEASV